MATKTFVVEKAGGNPVELQAERAEQDTATSRVTFFVGADQVGSFINVQCWYVKPTTS